MGLSNLLENVMSSLSEDNQLLSWSIYQETNGQIALKIRYQPTTEAVNRDMNAHYKKKPVKQVQRDRERNNAWRARQQAKTNTQQRADPVTLEKSTPPGDVSAVVTRAQTRSMEMSTRCDTPEVHRSDTTLQPDTDMIPILQPLDDVMLPCLQNDSSDNRRPSMESPLVQSRSTGNMSDGSETRTITSDVVPNASSHKHSDSDVTSAENTSDCELDSDEDQNTTVKMPRRGSCWMCAFWGQGLGKCQEHG